MDRKADRACLCLEQALVSNFWEAAASRGFESSLESETSDEPQNAQPAQAGVGAYPRSATAPVVQQKGPSPAASETPPKTVEVTKLPSAAPPPIHAAAMDFWRTAASGSVDNDQKPKSAPAKVTEERAAATKTDAVEFRPTQAPTPSTNLAANRFWQAAAQDSYGDSGRRQSGSRAGSLAEASQTAPSAEQPVREREKPQGSGLAAVGKQQSARLAAVRLRQAAAVRNTSLAMVKAGNVPLSSSASIRSSALRAATDSSDGGSAQPAHPFAHGRVRTCPRCFHCCPQIVWHATCSAVP